MIQHATDRRGSQRFARLHAIVLAAVSAIGVVGAHEFWIEPPATGSAPGDAVRLELYVGDGFPGERFARSRRHLARFMALPPAGADGPRDPVEVTGVHGRRPAGTVHPDVPGTWVAAYVSTPSVIELDGKTFQAYVLEEGLEAIAVERAARGEENRPARESYRRCSKTIFAVGGAGGERAARAVGLELELVPARDPLGLAVGDPLELVAVRDGQPAAGLTLHAFVRGTEGPVDRLVTDDRGRATISIDRPGVWMVSGVSMKPAREVADVEWESVWTSLTFRIR